MWIDCQPVEKKSFLKGTSEARLLMAKSTTLEAMLSRTINSWAPIQVSLPPMIVTNLQISLSAWNDPTSLQPQEPEPKAHKEHAHQQKHKKWLRSRPTSRVGFYGPLTRHCNGAAIVFLFLLLSTSGLCAHGSAKTHTNLQQQQQPVWV